MSRRRRALILYAWLLIASGVAALMVQRPSPTRRSEPPATTTPATSVPSATGETVPLTPETAAQGGSAPIAWRPLGEPGVGGQITALAISPFDSARVLASGDVLGVAVSQDAGETWEPTFGFASWEAAEFTFHPSRPEEIWVGTMSGPYVSTDGGHQWSARRDGLPAIAPSSYSAPIERVLFDPRDERHLLAFGGSHRRLSSPGRPAWGAVWESRDAGATWARKGTVADGKNIVSVTFADSSGSTLLAAVDQGGVYRSDDGGATWTASNAGLPSANIRSVAVDLPSSAAWASVGSDGTTPGGIWRSSDRGQTWRAANAGLDRTSGANEDTTSSYEVIAASATSPTILYTSDRTFRYASMYRSDDGGATWAQLLPPKSTFGGPWQSPLSADAIAIDPHDSDVVFVGQQEWIARSSDGGSSWTDVASRKVARGWVGRGFAGLVTTRVVFDDARAGAYLLTGMDGGNPLFTTDGGASYQRPLVDYDGYDGATDAAIGGPDGATLCVQLGQRGKFNGLATSVDGGAQWSVVSGADAGLPERNADATPGSVAVGTSSSTIWATVGGDLHRSTDRGSTWRTTSASEPLGDLAADPFDDDHLFVAGTSGVYESHDGGATLRLLANSPADVTRLVMDKARPGVLFAAAWRATKGGLFRFEAGQWALVRDDAFIADVAVDPFRPTRLLVATNDHPYHDVSSASGVWVSDDDGATWTQANDGLAQLRVATVAFDPHVPDRVIVGTYGRGFFVTGPS